MKQIFTKHEMNKLPFFFFFAFITYIGNLPETMAQPAAIEDSLLLSAIDQHGCKTSSSDLSNWSLSEDWYIDNTSFRVDASQLTSSNGVVVTTEGAVIEKLDIKGKIIIKANDVTVRDCRILSSENHGVLIDGNYSNITIEYNEIDGNNTARPRGNQAGINTQYADPNGSIIIRGNYIHGFNDAIKVRGGTLVEYNYIKGNGTFGGVVHSDGIQTPGVTVNNSTFSRNWIDCPKNDGCNSAIIVEVLNGPVKNILIKENYLNGGNFTLYVFTDAEAAKYGEPTDIWVVNNAFGPDYRYGLCYFKNESNNGSPVDTKENGWGHVGSYWYDNGQPISFNAIPLPIKDTVPTGLITSNITSSSVDLSWIACSDDTGVTGYNIYINGADPESSNGTNATISGLTQSTTYVFTVSGFDEDGNETPLSSEVSITTRIKGSIEYVSSETWQSFPLSVHTKNFTAEFDAVPNGNNVDALTGILNGTASEYDDVACIVRFNSKGQIDARDGDKYRSTNTVPYTQGNEYHFRLDIDIQSHTYNVYVTPQGEAEISLASDFKFRTAQQNVTELTGWALYAFNPSHSVSNMTFSGESIDSGTTTNINTMTVMASSISAYPNPIEDHFTIQVNGFEKQNSITVIITDYSGRLIYQKKYNSSPEGTNILNINYPFQNHGLYIVTVRNEYRTEQTKITVK